MKPSNEPYLIVASPIFKLSLQRLKAFLGMRFGENVARAASESIKAKIQAQLTTNPLVAPISERLFQLGLTDYRQFCVDEHNLVFFRIDTQQNEVQLLLVMDSRQSIQKLLFELNLLAN